MDILNPDSVRTFVANHIGTDLVTRLIASLPPKAEQDGPGFIAHIGPFPVSGFTRSRDEALQEAKTIHERLAGSSEPLTTDELKAVGLTAGSTVFRIDAITSLSRSVQESSIGVRNLTDQLVLRSGDVSWDDRNPSLVGVAATIQSIPGASVAEKILQALRAGRLAGWTATIMVQGNSSGEGDCVENLTVVFGSSWTDLYNAASEVYAAHIGKKPERTQS